MTPFLFLLLSMACITFTDGSNSSRHSFLLSEEPQLHKRQENSDPDSVCRSVAFAESCTNGQFQEKADVFLQCNDPEEARRIQNGCMRNSKGNFCGNDPALLRNRIRTACTSETSCNSECQEAVMNARRNFGCCVNIFNDTLYNNLPFNYSLWFRCNVEPVTEECQTSTISLPAQFDPSCDNVTLRHRLQSVECREEYVNSIRNRLLATEGCQNYTHPSKQECNANGDKTYCTLLIPLVTPNNYTRAGKSCSNTSTCEPHCVQTLNNITSTTGCCFVDRYNSTQNNKIEWLRKEFWSRCGLTSPGFCEEYLNNSVKDSGASFFVVIIAAIVLWACG